MIKTSLDNQHNECNQYDDYEFMKPLIFLSVTAKLRKLGLLKKWNWWYSQNNFTFFTQMIFELPL